ncbi:ABC transporter substrate-binding protein [Tardiphaga sp.]|uniref:ABC transporter substrate-binding protein n=1 Tax=Tardiphaga sp. TaxID=1926292 RepID=UPI0025DE83F4|nr:ABC transporter substrate-binding protein [Tardiphaga sp.]
MSINAWVKRKLAGLRPAFGGGARLLVCGVVLASPVSAAPGDKAAVVRTLATRVGSIVGAVSNCRGIARPRVQAMIDKFSAVIAEASANDSERVELRQQLDRSLADGRRALGNADTECAAAERQFADLERSIGASSLANTPAPALAAPVAAAAPAAAAPAAAGGVAVRGITDREIRHGIAAPFSGSSKELGRQMKLGLDTAFNRVNDAGGIDGRMLRLIAADDGYEPTRTPEAMAQLYDKEQVFCIIGNVGTPTAAVALPYALDRQMLFFGAFTGAPVLRRDPPDRYVFNYRASYVEETDAVVRYLVKVRRVPARQIAVMAQQDGYGDAGYAGVVKAMRALGAADQVPLRLNYKRNTVDVTDAITQLTSHKGTIKAVVMVASYRAAAKFIEKTRDLYPAMIYTNVSFVGSTALAEELKLLGPRFASGVIVTQVVPAVDGYSSAILEYKKALAKYFPGEAADYVSLEGYVTGNVLVQALRQASPQLDTERLVDSLESLRQLDMGLGTVLSFGRTEHQASHKVWGTALDENGRYQAIDLE